MRFSSVFVLASLVATSFATTVDDILNDISVISTKLNSLDDAITAFPVTGGSLAKALAIHSNAVSLGTSIDKATTDTLAVDPNPVSEADAGALIAAFEVLEPVIKHALVGIVDRRPAFTALPIGGIPALVKQDLNNLSASTIALEDALVSVTPESAVPEAVELRNRIDAAFATAIAAYA
ncbi:hypothetical protein D9615_004816 [Tricholomella constricta]|uniref:Hydrophobic surface binding protein n=1 Tax=Tricholomella constricta TaxID=117010 RepID=A0A8H5HHQ2_9AGAR|nr:hypothetical protein D9615_004816 [Tricholomella constricta]